MLFIFLFWAVKVFCVLYVETLRKISVLQIVLPNLWLVISFSKNYLLQSQRLTFFPVCHHFLSRSPVLGIVSENSRAQIFSYYIFHLDLCLLFPLFQLLDFYKTTGKIFLPLILFLVSLNIFLIALFFCRCNIIFLHINYFGI